MTSTEVTSSHGETPVADGLAVYNPATGEVAGTVPVMGKAEVADLAACLRAAQPAWEALGPEGRKVHLLKWLNWIVDNKDRILGLVHQEAGKSWGDAQIELLVAVEVINYYTKHGAAFLADEKRRPHNVSAATKKLRLLRRPYQLVGVITPWNYPLGMPMMDVPGALMAGAAVLSKPSEDTPLAWAEVVRGWEEIGAPPVLGIATGFGDTGRAVVDEVDMVQFTGSTATGRAIGIRAAERLIPASLELGGKDAMIVLDDADLDRAVHGAVWGGLFNSGQSCVAVERIYVEDRVYDEFVERLVKAASDLRVAHDAVGEFAADYGALANDKQMKIVEDQVADAVAKGARVLTGGTRLTGKGLFFPPTVLVDVDHSMTTMTEETFGPLLPVMRVSGEEEAIRLANDSPYGLSGSVWTTSKDRAERVGRRVEAGGLNVNNAMTHVFQFPLPMGGWKSSGLGHRFGGANGIRKYCRQQAFVSERVNLKRELHWYPNTRKKAEITEKALRLLGLHDWRRRLGRSVPGAVDRTKDAR